MSRTMDLIGNKYERLTVIERAPNTKQGKTRWLCKCSCSSGKMPIVDAASLIAGRSKSCGCLQKEIVSDRITIYNLSNSHTLKDRVFERLTVIGRSKVYKNKRYLWDCKCSCGNTKIFAVCGSALLSGNTKSCGCLKLELAGKATITHGLSHTRLYRIYCGMKNRCLNPSASDYSYYGGRGITICKEWIDDFTNFYNWAIANEYDDKLSIDRKDNEGNYEPNNCRWATDSEQMINRRPFKRKHKEVLNNE